MRSSLMWVWGFISVLPKILATGGGWLDADADADGVGFLLCAAAKLE